MGLWCALSAARRGARVTLIERDRIGAGASGGMLGALMPHQPTGWNAKKQFQLDGLMSLPDRIADLEADTGHACGYARCGRIMPIAHAEKRRQSAQWALAAVETWPADCGWQVRDDSPCPGWVADHALPHGCNHDTLSARIDPRRLVAALAAALRDHPGVAIVEGVGVAALGRDGALRLATGDEVTPGKTIIAAGVGAFTLVDADDPERIGRPVKGQGALLRPTEPIDPLAPILYDGGVYVIAHASGHVAVGSTSENEFEAPDTTDDKLDALVDRARALCPALANAAIVERWAGLRPRAVGREPLVGPLPGFADTILATGGFKISFAIAHLMADAAIDFAMGQAPANLPDVFLPETRLTPPRSSQRTGANPP